MQLNEILDNNQPESTQEPTVTKIENVEFPVNLSNFLQYPIMDQAEPVTDDITFSQITMPAWHPQAEALITRLRDATATLEVLEVLHDAFRLYCRGQLVIDVEADDWPDFYDEILK